MSEKHCYICPSDRFVHNHHYDRSGGKISGDTVPLCRRCHFTLEDLDLRWFDDEYLDRALEVWNRGNQLLGIPLVSKEEVLRRKYPLTQLVTTTTTTTSAGKLKRPELIVEPMCGWEWIDGHIAKFPEGLPEQCLVIIHDGKEVATVRIYRKGLVKAAMKGVG